MVLFFIDEGMNMSQLQHHQLAATFLRLALGVVLLSHSAYLKFVIFTLEGTAGYFTSIGLPGFLAYLVFFVEVTAGIAFLLGLQVRFFSLLILPVFLGATWVHWTNGWLFTNQGGGWEYPLLLVVLCPIQYLLGSGLYSIEQPIPFAKKRDPQQVGAD